MQTYCYGSIAQITAVKFYFNEVVVHRAMFRNIRTTDQELVTFSVKMLVKHAEYSGSKSFYYACE